MERVLKRFSKGFMVIGMALTLLLSYFIPSIVHAEPIDLRLQMDAGSVSGNVFTFNVNNINVTATVSGSNYTINGNNIELTSDHLNDLKITLGDTFDSSTMSVEFHTGDVINVNGDNELVFVLDDFPENAPHIQIMPKGGSGSGGGTNTIDYNGNGTSELDYIINGTIEYDGGNGYDYGIGFKINGIQYKADDSKAIFTQGPMYERDADGNLILDGNNDPIPVMDPDTNQPLIVDNSLTITGDTIHYDYDTNTNKVNFVFTMAPGTLMTKLTINNVEITNLPKSANELMACYVDHNLEIPVNNIDKADKYVIEIEARFPEANEEYGGNFLWDYNPEGYTGPDDKILNGTLEFVSAEYDGHTYTTPEEVNALGGIYIWKDAVRKKTYTDDREGLGEAQFPKGTKLTVKIIPDAGYQLVSFGVNGGEFEPQETIGTYTFEVEGGPFHLQASIQQVSDVVKTTANNISRGTIDLEEESSMAIGTARLDVKDIDLSEEQITNFEEAAEGYEIKNFIDISLYNTVYKGSETQSWDTRVKDLDHEATIALKLEDYANGEEIVIVHETHDGKYEIIPVQIDEENGMITFKTKSFSNYAVAAKGALPEKVYTVRDDNGNEIMFEDPEGKSYILTIIDYLSIPKEELLSTYNVPEEEYDAIMDAIKEKTSKYGDFVGFFEIVLQDENGDEVHDGPFKIKIKMTDAMKKYNTFKIIYLNDQLEIEEPITLTEEDGYLVGIIPHLSKYIVTGSNTTSPKTSDNIDMYLMLLGIGTFGLIGINIIRRKRFN